MSVVAEEPPEDADEWTEEQWREWLATAPADPDSGRAHPLTRAIRTSGGSMLAAAMLGLDQAIYGERPKTEVVAEAAGDDLDDDALELDLDDPAASRIRLTDE